MTRFPDKPKNLDVLLCHDWLTGMRGGEKVLEILCNWFPSADIMALIARKDSVSESIGSHHIHTSFMQSWPGIFKNYRMLLPFFPWAVSSIKAPSAEVMISTSHCVAKSVPKPDGARHLCYCFTPMRYAWLFHDEYLGRNPLKRMLAAPLLARMRKWDLKTAANVDMFVAISRHVQERIQRFYKRDAKIVYPPVDTDRLTPADASDGNFDLVVSAMVPYKKVDLAVDAYRLNGKPLKIVGIGSELASLRKKASANIEFLEWQSDEDILDLYRSCRSLIFPGEEDFGIVPVEAQSCGKPVVAYGKGGATETVVDGVSGVFFKEQTAECLAEAVERASAKKWDQDSIRQNALRFSTQRFVTELAQHVTELRK